MMNYKHTGAFNDHDTVKKEMLFDHCTWDDDYKEITEIPQETSWAGPCREPEYIHVLMQAAGPWGESVLTSSAGPEDCLLIASNGAYGDRMADIAKHGFHSSSTVRSMTGCLCGP